MGAGLYAVRWSADAPAAVVEALCSAAGGAAMDGPAQDFFRFSFEKGLTGC